MPDQMPSIQTVPAAECLISASSVRRFLGGVSDMTLHRWLKDPDLGFPEPTIICRRRYWKRGDIDTWLADRRQGVAA